MQKQQQIEADKEIAKGMKKQAVGSKFSLSNQERNNILDELDKMERLKDRHSYNMNKQRQSYLVERQELKKKTHIKEYMEQKAVDKNLYILK